MLATELQARGRGQRAGWGGLVRRVWCLSLWRCDGPFEGVETDSLFLAVWGSARELAPCHRGVTRGEGLASAAWGSVQGALALAQRPETMGACGRGAGIAGWRGSGTFLSSAPTRNLILEEQAAALAGGTQRPPGCGVCSR